MSTPFRGPETSGARGPRLCLEWLNSGRKNKFWRVAIVLQSRLSTKNTAEADREAELWLLSIPVWKKELWSARARRCGPDYRTVRKVTRNWHSTCSIDFGR